MRKNPYIIVSLIWIFLSIIQATFCVVFIYKGENILSIIMLISSVSFGFVSGLNFQKALEIYHLNAQAKWLHEIAQELAEMGKTCEQMKNNEPFKEFDTQREVPFEEVRNKEKLQ